MMLVGFIVLWLICLYLFQKPLMDWIQKIQQRDEKRIGNLQQRLHKNFVFREKNNIQTSARWILIIGTILSVICRSSLIFGLVLVLYLFFPLMWIQWIEYNRKKKFQKQLLMMIPLLSSMLRSGHGLERALKEVKNNMQPPMSDEIHFMLKEMQLGSTLDEALGKLVERFHSENLLTLAHAILISRKLGTSLSQAMDHISENILKKEKLKQQIHSLTSQGKMQAYLAVCMPFFMGLVLHFVSPGYFQPLFETFVGKCSMGYGVVSMIVGLLWIRSITHKEYL